MIIEVMKAIDAYRTIAKCHSNAGNGAVRDTYNVSGQN